MKRIITILAAGAFMLGVTACGGKDSKSHVTEENNESVEFSVSEMDIPADVSTDNDTLSVDFDEADITDTDSETSDCELTEEADAKETNWQKTKDVYRAAKDKMKRKKDEWKEEHADQIEEAKEKGRELKSKTKEKIGNWLDRTRQKLEED